MYNDRISPLNMQNTQQTSNVQSPNVSISGTTVSVPVQNTQDVKQSPSNTGSTQDIGQRKRGRPRKYPPDLPHGPLRPRGRPRKDPSLKPPPSPPRPRGRPRKNPVNPDEKSLNTSRFNMQSDPYQLCLNGTNGTQQQLSRRRGRPPKSHDPENEKQPRKRGRPKKITEMIHTPTADVNEEVCVS